MQVAGLGLRAVTCCRFQVLEWRRGWSIPNLGNLGIFPEGRDAGRITRRGAIALAVPWPRT